jgi:hypothetical protein
LPGGTALTPEKQMERAIAFARQRPEHVGAKLKAISVAPTALSEFREAFAVDLKAGVVVKRTGASDGDVAKRLEKKRRRNRQAGLGKKGSDAPTLIATSVSAGRSR